MKSTKQNTITYDDNKSTKFSGVWKIFVVFIIYIIIIDFIGLCFICFAIKYFSVNWTLKNTLCLLNKSVLIGH